MKNCIICGKERDPFCPCDLDWHQCICELQINYDRWVSEFPPESRLEKAA